MADSSVSSRDEPSSIPGRGPLAPRLAALSAARELVTERGFSVGVRDIAAAAGIDHAVVIRYFGSKAGLLDAVLATDGADLLAAVGEPGESGRGLRMVRQARAGRQEALLVVRAGLDGRTECDAHDLPVVREWVEALKPERTPGTSEPLLTASGAVFVAVSLAAGYAVLEPYERARVGHEFTRRDMDAFVGRSLDALLALPERTDLPEGVMRSRRRQAAPEDGTRPAPSGPPPRGRDEVKQAILDAAVDLFASREIGAVSVRNIAKRARVNHSLLFRHFGSKEGVLRGAIQRAADEIDAGLSATSTNGAGLLPVVRLIRGDSRIVVLTAQALLSGYAIEDVQAEFPAASRMVAVLEEDRGRLAAMPAEAVVLCLTSLLFGSVLFETVLRSATGMPAATDIDVLVTDAAESMVELTR